MTYQERVHKLQQQLCKNCCDAILVDDHTDLFYLTGLDLSAGTLWVHRDGVVLFVDSRYFELCTKKSPFPVRLLDSNGLSGMLKQVPPIHRLAFDSVATSYSAYEHMKAVLITIELVPIESPLKQQRAIKDAEEIHLLADAGALGSLGFDFVCSLLREGISEKECAVELEIFWKRQGSKSLAFDPIIAFGANSSIPHYRAGNGLLKQGDVVLIDIGVNFKHYHSDMTRTLFYGQPDPRLAVIHPIVVGAQLAALKLCRPGTLVKNLDAAARGLIASHGYGDQFVHSLGHGVGLDIHEFPSLKNSVPFSDIPLAAGMVITIEPGIYLPGVGGVRIEDTIVITEEGFDNLTNRKRDPFLKLTE
ncbi:MAG: Xaa-Pro peptidase family protein [Parachlamydiaceae bacterium]